MEWTYNLTQASSLTLGAGLSQTKDKTNPANDFKETTGTMRFSYSF
ncbi:MAG: hypothetical protein HY551_03135 [Elusimicrobia bacterium]|nr:hypothetical protein [Elusimicrobiota bacterium]